METTTTATTATSTLLKQTLSETFNEDSSYKLRKEQFVYGLEGTTPWELLFICSTTFTGIVLYYYCIRNNNNHHLHQREQQQHRSVTVVVHAIICEVFYFILPMIVCQTIWMYPYGCIYVIIEVLLSIVIVVTATNRFKTCTINHSIATSPAVKTMTTAETRTTEGTEIFHHPLEQIQATTMTIYRSCILVLTIISILAVDFHIYPRKYGKTEIIGYGLMDLGAASNIIMAALSSSRARSNNNNYNSGGDNRQQPSKHQSTAIIVTKKLLRKMMPLLLMGTIRLVTHKGIEYPEHNSEYGIHWNFFFTLSFIIPITTLLSYVYGSINKKPNWSLSVFILIVYQYMLSYRNLQDFIVNAPRTCPATTTTDVSTPYIQHMVCYLWYANREGIVGCISYAALYLLTEYIAHAYFWNVSMSYTTTDSKPKTAKFNMRHVWETTKPLWYVVATLFVAWQALISSIFACDVSRRSTNTIFCIWVLFVNLFQFVSIYTIILLCCATIKPLSLHPPLLLSSINRNGLYIFIIANLFTGIINLSIDTMSVSNIVAICIVLLYISVVGCVSILLDRVLSQFSRRSSPSIEAVKED